MNFNTKSFRKVAEDGKSVTLEHEKLGHKITIAKAAAGPKMKSDLALMPLYMKDGGSVFDSISEYFSPKEEENMTQDPSMAPAQQQAPIEQPKNPEQEALKEQYNRHVTNMFGPDKPPVMPGITFGEDGTAPENINPDAMQAAQKTLAYEKLRQQNMKFAEANEAYQNALKQNEARAAVGMAPVPVPPPPQKVGIVPASNVQMGGEMGSQMQNANGVQQQPVDQSQLRKDVQQESQYGNTYKNQIAGINAEAKAIGEAGNEQAMIQQQRRNEMQALQDNLKVSTNDIMARRKEALEKMGSGEINPNHYAESLSTAGKVGTAIGLLLSGLGGGTNGVDVLNKQIERDINAQKESFGQKQTILSELAKEYGDINDAAKMASIIMTDKYTADIAASAAKSQDPLAKARAQQLIATLQKKNLIESQSLAQKQALLRGMSSGAVGSPELIIKGLVPEKEQAKYFEELQKAQENAELKDSVMKDYDELSRINTPGNRISDPLGSKESVKALKDSIGMAIAKKRGMRWNEFTQKSLESQMPDMFKNSADPLKRRAVEQIFSTGDYPLLKSVGINPDKFSKHKDPEKFKSKEGAIVQKNQSSIKPAGNR